MRQNKLFDVFFFARDISRTGQFVSEKLIDFVFCFFQIRRIKTNKTNTIILRNAKLLNSDTNANAQKYVHRTDFFHGQKGWAERFLQVLVTGIVTNYKQIIPSHVYIALSKCRSHQLH